jgi:SnoaL-like domain
MSENESADAAEGTRTAAETTNEATPSIEWIREFARQWIDAWNSHEVDRLLVLMSEDIEYRDDAWPKPMRRHAAAREFLEAGWRAFPDMTFELLDGPYVIPGEPRAALHWRDQIHGRQFSRRPLTSTSSATTAGLISQLVGSIRRR